MTFLDQFLEMMARERGATRSTLSAYDADLRNFYGFLNDQTAEKATFADIQDYLTTQSHLSSATVARRLSSLRQFYAYLVNTGATKESPLPFIKVAHVKPRLLSSLSTIHVESLLKGAKAWNEPEGKRLSALLQILQTTDMLVKQIVSLPFGFNEVSLAEKNFSRKKTIRTSSSRASPRENGELGVVIQEQKTSSLKKNEKLLTGLLRPAFCRARNDALKTNGLLINNTTTSQVLHEYLKVRPYFLAHGQDSPWLFPSSSQKGHLTPQRFGQLLKELGLKIGIDPVLISLSTFRCGLHQVKNNDSAHIPVVSSSD